MAMITEVYAREILDSRGNPTIELKLRLVWVLLLVSSRLLWQKSTVNLVKKNALRS